ncbi:Tify domain-containing protein [Dioscorea alata]|uniref:Tify domain-containing protein n=1 Tax=Dioscorea alata TaxID=55571 RepID=A0ACB7U847_DIOAL|nr:Tify domain-containing protein [Dioscorea alata]
MSTSPSDEATALPVSKKPEKPASTFTLTCNLLSQFLKDRKPSSSFPDLSLGISAPNPPDLHHRVKTMNLLPGVDVAGGETGNENHKGNAMDLNLFPQRAGFAPSSSPAPAEGSRELEKPQLTIFYGGKVLVFDNFPASKAMDLLNLAGKQSAPAEAPVIAGEPTKSVSPSNSAIPSTSVAPPVAAVRPPCLTQASGTGKDFFFFFLCALLN